MTEDDYLFDPNQIPRQFSEKYFHDPNNVIPLLELDDLPPDIKSILDVGCGNNTVVEELRKQGYEAYGIDLAQTDTDQTPDVTAMSHQLPFANNQFDVVTNLWGGLSYPLQEIDNLSTPELQKKALIRFVEELREAARVGKEVRSHPAFTSGFFEATGIFSITDPNDSSNILIISIDFKSVFDEANIKYRTGNTQIDPPNSADIRTSTIILETADANLEAFDKLIERLRNAPEDKKLFYDANHLMANFPQFHNALQEFNKSESQRLMNKDNIFHINKNPVSQQNQDKVQRITKKLKNKLKIQTAKSSELSKILNLTFQQIRDQLVLNP